jgi:hypothetical protein
MPVQFPLWVYDAQGTPFLVPGPDAAKTLPPGLSMSPPAPMPMDPLAAANAALALQQVVVVVVKPSVPIKPAVVQIVPATTADGLKQKRGPDGRVILTL